MNQTMGEALPDFSEIVKGLANLSIQRITKSFLFQTCIHYLYETQIVVRNDGESPCYIIPGGFYLKQVLVDFNVSDIDGKRCVFIPSRLNDSIVLGFVFFKLWTRNTKLSFRSLLREIFIGDSANSAVSHQNMETIQPQDFKGKFAEAFFKAMWSSEKKIADLLEEPVVNYLFDKTAFTEYADLRISDLYDDDLKEFCKSLDEYFLLLIQLNSPVLPKSYQEVLMKDNKFFDEKTHNRNIWNIWKFPNAEKYDEFEFDFKPVLPNQSGVTFHIKITPPEGVKLDLTSNRFSYFLRKNRYRLSWENRSLDPEKFAVIHLEKEVSCGEKICVPLLEKLKIQRKRFSFTKREESPSQIHTDVKDVRAQLQEDIVFLYFGGREKTSDCKKKHGLLISLNLKDRAMILYHFLVITLWIIFIAATFWLIWTSASNVTTTNFPSNSYFAILNQYFWSLITTMLAQSIATIVDYSNRTISERFFLKPTLQTITALTILEFLLLVFLPLILRLVL